MEFNEPCPYLESAREYLQRFNLKDNPSIRSTQEHEPSYPIDLMLEDYYQWRIKQIGFRHLHLATSVDQKHTLKFIKKNNLNETGISWENSGEIITQTSFRKDNFFSFHDINENKQLWYLGSTSSTNDSSFILRKIKLCKIIMIRIKLFCKRLLTTVHSFFKA